MRLPKIWIWLAILAVLLGVVSIATAAQSPPKPPPQASTEVTQVSADASGAGIQNVGSSTLANVTPALLPIGTAFDLCLTVYVQSPDVEYMDHFEADLPDGWTINSIAGNSDPPANGCSAALPPVPGVGAGNIVYWQSTGYPPQTGCGAWNGGGAGTNFDFCINVTIPDTAGAPWTLPWYYVGDGWGNPPHELSGSYGPVEPVSPILLQPDLIEEIGCPCGMQQHELTVANGVGYDTHINLSYEIITGTGTCSGPPSVFVPDGTSYAFAVNLLPVGEPGDRVACEVYAEDASDPANSDTAMIVKYLIASNFDPAGWQLEPIATATPNQWASGAAGANPAAAGPVGYVVGGLAAGSGLINPDLQMYDPGAGTWTQLADLPNPRFSPVVGWIGGLLYAAGGYDAAFGATGDLQVYDPGTNTWDNTNPADLPVLRGGGAGGVGVCSDGSGPCLFHVGGGPDSQFASTTLETWQYDPTSNAWTQLDDKPAGSSLDGHILGAGVGCMGQIYVGGDYRGYHEFFRLDATQPAGSQWTQLADSPPDAGAMTPALVCKEDWGKILLIGGDPYGGWSGYNDTVYVYDIATDTWEGPLPHTLHVAQTGSVAWHMADRVWTAGGTIGSGAIDPMPFESLLQVTCDPAMCYDLFGAWKAAPPLAEYGDVFSYAVTVEPQYLMEGLYMVDPLPGGVEYAGNLSWSMGDAWYDPVGNAVHWEYTDMLKIASPAVPVPRLEPDPAAAADLDGGPEVQGAPPALDGVPLFAFPKGVLWDNGPLITHPGECGGMDASRLQSDLSMNTLGFGNQLAVGNHMADDFSITDPLGWEIDQITFFAYQTNAPATSTITGVYYQIWDGPPDDPASHIVFGDLATNRLISTAFTLIQRDSVSNPCTNARYIMANVASAGVTLPPGTYWIDWMTDGSLSSGPWAPPITIAGLTTTGNALQYTTSSGAWGPANDSGTLTQQGMPFIIEGDPVLPPEITFDVTVAAHCGDIIVNEGVVGLDVYTKPFGAATMIGGEAVISASPSPLEVSLHPDSTGVEILTICNEGDCPLVWELHEMTPTPKVVSIPPSDGNFPRGEGAPSAGPAPIEAPPDGVPITPPSQILGTEAYATEAVHGFHTMFDLDVPEVLPNLGPFAPDGFPGAGEYVNGHVYVADTTNTLYRLDPATGAVFNFYPITAPPNGETYSGFALDPTSGVLYGSSTNIGTSSLLQVDPTTGVATLIGPITGSGCNIAIAIDGTGQMYGYDICTDDFWAIDKNTGAGTLIGSIGFDANYGQGMGWDQATNQMYMTAFNAGTLQPELRIVDLTTGNTTMVGGPLGSTDPTGICQLPWLGIPPYRVYPDLPWMSESPITGTVPWGECQDVEVLFDTTDLTPGDYTGDLLILSNDLGAPTVTVGVHLIVEPGLEYIYLPLVSRND
jgi:hypothetical protein